jgi:arylsulfatase A-like enzyme
MNSMNRKVWELILGAAIVLTPHPNLYAQNQGKPNIVFILMDNLGWGELGVYGGGILRGAPTPRIDQLAAEGLRLLNYNVDTECVPTRASLMTGRHAIRTGTLKSPVSGQPNGLVRWEVTIADLLRAGLPTLYGKWHLGDQEASPNDRGFDEWYGIRTSSEAFQDFYSVRPADRSAPIHPCGQKGEKFHQVEEHNLDVRRHRYGNHQPDDRFHAFERRYRQTILCLCRAHSSLSSLQVPSSPGVPATVLR